MYYIPTAYLGFGEREKEKIIVLRVCFYIRRIN
jgi:hypothetical protein